MKLILNLLKKEISSNKETILVKFKNKKYKIKKFCPHQNYSLRKGIIDKKGIITLPCSWLEI